MSFDEDCMIAYVELNEDGSYIAYQENEHDMSELCTTTREEVQNG